MSGPTRFRPLSVADLAALQLPDREDIAEGGLLVAGSVTLFSAREKSGKTMFCTDLVCSVTQEQTFLDRAVLCVPAIFIALEQNIREVRQRILNRLGPQRDVPLFVLPANGFTDDVFRLDHPASMGMFAAMIKEYDARVIVIDTMREAHRLHENEADDMAPLMRPLRQVAHDTNSAIVLVHHMSRAGSSRGSTSIAAGVDQLWSFQRTDTDQDSDAPPVGKLTVEGRFGPRQVIGVRLGDRLRWQVDNTVMLNDQTMRGRILAALRHGAVSGMTAQETADALDARLKTVQNEIARLLQETPAPLIATGTGKRNDPRRYAVIDPGLFPPIETSRGNVWEPILGINDDDDSQSSGNNGNSRRLIVPNSQPPTLVNSGINEEWPHLCIEPGCENRCTPPHKYHCDKHIQQEAA
jgi:hypothetical protein